jgi:mRNA interferase HigB
MHVIAGRTLREFWQRHSDAQGALEAWLAHVQRADWRNPADVKRDHSDADVLPGDRVVFNIRGNRYRLVVKVRYVSQVVYVRFVGTHEEYDRIDATNI